VQTVRAHHQQVLAVVGAGLGVVGTALVQAVVLAMAVAPGLALLGPVAVDDTHLPSSP
jgi:hypothetical protein